MLTWKESLQDRKHYRKERKLEFKAQCPEQCTDWIESIDKFILKKPSMASNNDPDFIQSHSVPQEEKDNCEYMEDSNFDETKKEESNKRTSSITFRNILEVGH